MRRVVLLALAMGLLLSVPAAAQPGVVAGRLRQPALEDPSDGTPDFMALTGTFSTLFQLDALGRGGGNPPATQAFNKTSVYSRIWLPEGFALTGFFRYEPAPRPDAVDRFFSDQTLWVDALYLRWTNGLFSVFGGKIHPRFGVAWAAAPGLYGNDTATDYELREKLGIGVRLWTSELMPAGWQLGQHNIQVEAFTADTSFLSAGALARRFEAPSGTVTDPVTGTATAFFRRRWMNSRAAGGPDNQDGVGGFAASAAGVRIPLPMELGDFGYTVAWASRRPGRDATLTRRATQERRLAAAVFGQVSLPGGMKLLPLVELVHSQGDLGFQGRQATWGVASATLQRDAWALSFTQLWRRRDVADTGSATRLNEHIIGITADLHALSGWDWMANMTLAGDWRAMRENGQWRQGVGIGLLWTAGFGASP